MVGSKLGALNHALLTLRRAEVMSLRVAGYIVNHPVTAADIATQTNVQSLAHLTDVPCLGVVPFTPLRGEIEQDRPMLATLGTHRPVETERLARCHSWPAGR